MADLLAALDFFGKLCTYSIMSWPKHTTTGNVVLPPEGELGPAMRALPTDRMRAFVIAMQEPSPDGRMNYARAAREAGFAEGTDAREAGHRLAHDDRIQAAMLEEGIRRFGAAIPVATATIVQIMMNPLAKSSEKMKAAAMILNRVGIPERTEHHVKSERIYSEAEKLERALNIARDWGLDASLIFARAGLHFPGQKEIPHVQEAEYEVVGSSEGLEDFLGVPRLEPAAKTATTEIPASAAAVRPDGIPLQDSIEKLWEP